MGATHAKSLLPRQSFSIYIYGSEIASMQANINNDCSAGFCDVVTKANTDQVIADAFALRRHPAYLHVSLRLMSSL